MSFTPTYTPPKGHVDAHADEYATTHVPFSPAQDAEKYDDLAPIKTSTTTSRSSRTGKAKPWQPFIFGWLPTVIFVALLLAMVGGLETFVRLSHLNTGFSVPSQGVRGLLTYGPVVLLLFVGWTWQMYDLEVKKLAPWMEMRNRPSKAHNSLLLDYIGANYVEVVQRAMRRKHWPVLLVTLGSGLIALSTVVATSLWIVLLETMPPVTTSLVNTFVISADSFRNVSEDVYLSKYLGKRVYGLPTPQWFYRDMIVSPFELLENDRHHTGIIAASTAAYSGRLDCSPIDISDAGNFTYMQHIDQHYENYTMWQAKAKWDGCEQVVNVTYANPWHAVDYASNIYSSNCSTSNATLLLMNQFTVSPANLSIPSTYTGMACEPKFTKHKLSLIVNASSFALIGEPVVVASEDKVALSEGVNLLTRFRSTGGDDNRFESWDWPGSKSDNLTKLANTLDTWHALVARVYDMTAEEMLNADLVAANSEELFKDLFPYIAEAAYLQPSQDKFDGEWTNIEYRLVSKDSSVHVVQAALSLLAILLVALSFLHPHTHLLSDPGSAADVAAILAKSPAVTHQFSGTGSMSEKEIHAHLSEAKFQTVIADDGEMRVVAHDTGSLYISPRDAAETFWQPPMHRLLAKIILLLLLAAIIIALEVLYRFNERNKGLADLSIAHWHHISWMYIAPAILFLVGLGITSFDFALRATQPYAIMAKEPQSARLLSYNPLTHNSYILIPYAIRHGVYLVAVSASVMLLLPAAKIAVAGVFIPGKRLASVDVSLQQLSSFNLSTGPTETKHTGALFMFSYLPEWGLGLPTWVTNSTAVTSVDMSVPDGSIVTARLPVMYAGLSDCHTINYKFTQIGNNPTQVVVPDTDCYGFNDRFLLANETFHMGRVKSSNWNSSCPYTWFGFGEIAGGNILNPNALLNASRYTLLQCTTSMTASTMPVTLSFKNGDTEIINIDRTSEKEVQRWPLYYNEDPTALDTMVIENQHFDPFFQVMTRKYTNTSLETYLDPVNLEVLAREGWSAYWAIYADRWLRLDDVNDNHAIPAVYSFLVSRLVMANVPTRLLEGIIGAIFLVVLTISFLAPRRTVLSKPPFSVGAQISLLVDGGVVPLLQQRWTASGQFLDGICVQLGWWTCEDSLSKWYGIDVVNGVGGVPLESAPFLDPRHVR